jgi:hypothetical protein
MENPQSEEGIAEDNVSLLRTFRGQGNCNKNMKVISQ